MRPLFLAIVLTLFLVACGGQDDSAAPNDTAPAAPDPAASEPADAQPADDQTPAPTQGQTEAVAIVDFSFDPAELEVPVGTTVAWTQMDSSRHTVDFDDGQESGELAQDDTYSRTFDEPGEYPYACFFHPRMTGTVTVD